MTSKSLCGVVCCSVVAGWLNGCLGCWGTFPALALLPLQLPAGAPEKATDYVLSVPIPASHEERNLDVTTGSWLWPG